MKITLLMAQSLDGRIALSSDHFPDWTGKADKRFFADFSKRAGVVIMGRKTFDTFETPLPGRKNVVMTRRSRRSSGRPNLVYTRRTPEQVVEMLQSEGFSHAVLAGGATINSLFARSGLIDEIIVSVCPKIFGNGLSLFAPEVAMELELIDVRRLDRNGVLLTYRPAPSDPSRRESMPSVIPPE